MPLLLQIDSTDLNEKDENSTDNISDEDDGSKARDDVMMLVVCRTEAALIRLVDGIISVSLMSGFSPCFGGIFDADSSVR